MKISTRHSMRIRLEKAVIAFFILAALSLLVVYLADPAIYAQSLTLTSSPAQYTIGSNISTRFPDDLKKVARSPARLVETLKEITPALQEEGIVVGLPPETALVTLTSKST